jgi:hypothetical protein
MDFPFILCSLVMFNTQYLITRADPNETVDIRTALYVPVSWSGEKMTKEFVMTMDANK